MPDCRHTTSCARYLLVWRRMFAARSDRTVSHGQLVGVHRRRMNEDATVPSSSDGLGLGFGDAAMEDIGGLGPQTRPVRLPVDLIPALGGFAAKRFHPLDTIAAGVGQLENECHSVFEFIGA